MAYRTISTYVDVDVDLEDFEDDDLIDELEDRGYIVNGSDRPDNFDSPVNQLLTSIYQKRRIGKDFDIEVEQLLWYTLGRM